MNPLRRVLSLSLLTAALASTGLAHAADFEARTVKFPSASNKGHPQVQGVEKFAELMAKKTNGKFKVQAFPGGALGPDLQTVSAMQGGTVEMTVMNASLLAGVAKEMAIFDFPFLFNNTKEADAVSDGPVGQKLLNKLQDKGLVGLAYWENGFRNLTNSKRPVTKLEDLNDVKLRVMQNNVYLDSFKLLGANAVPMPFSELFSALETKTVDGQENPYNTILSSKFYEVQKYLSVTNHVYSPWIVTVSKKWWDGLSKTEQKILLDAARVSRDFERKDTRDEAAKALGDLKAKGMQINELSVAEVNRMRDKLTHVNAGIATNVGMDLWNDTQNELTRLRAKK